MIIVRKLTGDAKVIKSHPGQAREGCSTISPPYKDITYWLWVCPQIAAQFVKELRKLRCRERREVVEDVPSLGVAIVVNNFG